MTDITQDIKEIRAQLDAICKVLNISKPAKVTNIKELARKLTDKKAKV